MYIAAKTADGETIYWTGVRWSDDISDAESYGSMSGHFEMGKLEVEYVEEERTFNGSRITRIFDL